MGKQNSTRLTGCTDGGSRSFNVYIFYVHFIGRFLQLLTRCAICKIVGWFSSITLLCLHVLIVLCLLRAFQWMVSLITNTCCGTCKFVGWFSSITLLCLHILIVFLDSFYIYFFICVLRMIFFNILAFHKYPDCFPQ